VEPKEYKLKKTPIIVYFCGCGGKLEKRNHHNFIYYWCPNCGVCYFKKDLQKLKVEKISLI